MSKTFRQDPSLIDEIDRQLEAWARSLLDGVAVEFLPPSQPSGRGVVFFLSELRNAQPARGGRRSYFEMAARYLVTAWAEDPLEEHRMLAELAFGAMRDKRYDLELEPPPLEFWAAFGSRPRAAFHLRVPVRREVDRPTAKPIVEPVRLQHSTLGVWEGRVLARPSDFPLAGARIEFPHLRRAVTTDSQGRFRLTGVPLSSPPTQARVSARGKEFVVSAQDWDGEDGTVTIRLDILEV